MFSSIGWGEILVLLVAALVILGPERLPGAAQWTARALRRARDYATGATADLKQDFGAEFDDLRAPLAELRAPLAELRRLRTLNPQTLLTRHLLGDEPLVPEDLRTLLATGSSSTEAIDSGNFGLFPAPPAPAAVDLTKRPAPAPPPEPTVSGAPPADHAEPGIGAHPGEPAS
ncbi:Sec-independent protein translocase protein TatB [Nocardia sp. NPDC003963]